MLQRILVAVVGIPLLLFVVLWAPVWATAAFLFALCVIAAHELISAVCGKEKGNRWFGLAGIMGICVILLSAFSGVEEQAEFAMLIKWLLAAFVVLLFVCVVVEYGKPRAISFLDLTTILVAGIAIPAALGCLMRLRMLPYGGGMLLIVLVAAFCSDTLALFAGMLFGKHKLAPKVSPKKTVEGAIGGLVFCVLAFVGFALIYNNFLIPEDLIWIPEDSPQLPVGLMAVVGLLAGIVSMVGDLTMSLIKRHYGIKDYGKLLPGHGGFLDRFDSVIAVAVILAVFLGATII